MNVDKKITMPRDLWARISAMIEREGMPKNFSEAMRHISLNAVEKSEQKEVVNIELKGKIND